MSSSLIGESAAILTSVFWTGSSLMFTSAGKKIGSFSVNAYRTTMAIGFLLLAHVAFLGVIIPAATNVQWFWMGLSGIVGLGIGDFGLFAAYVAIGPRRTVLIQASSPIFACVTAYLILGEELTALSIIGITITLAGITIVLLEKQETLEDKLLQRKRKIQGIFFGLISATGQGVGAALSKKGMNLSGAEAMNPVSAALIRMLLAGVFVWLSVLLAGRLPEASKAIKNKAGIKYTAAGAIVGPFIGMTFSMTALAEAQAGIAQTLMSLMPIFIIPVVWILYREKTNWRGIIGAVVAVTGVAILLLI